MGEADELILFLQHNAGAVTVMLGVAAGAVILSWNPVKAYIRGTQMREQRRKELHTMLADGYTEKVMDMISLGQLTWTEAREEGFNRLKRAYPACKDLYPSEQSLKERIEKTLKTGVHAPPRVRKLLFARKK